MIFPQVKLIIMTKPKKKIKDDVIKLNMAFEEAVKKALITPLPKSKNKKAK